MNQTTENQAVGQDPAVEFGRILRLGREEKGLSIGEVAERLKLSAKQIEAFESGNYEGMPEGVFIRGFLRSYGRFLDLDEQAVSMHLDRIVPQSGKSSYNVEPNTSSSLNYQNQKIEKPFPTWIFGVIAIAIIIAGVYIWQGKSKEENAKQTSRSEESVSLGEVAAHLNGTQTLLPCEATFSQTENESLPDLCDVKGQHTARLALEIAAAGGHSLLMLGPPGTGKSMLAQRLPSILPPLTDDELASVWALRSLVPQFSGCLKQDTRRPFRAPHHSASSAALVGGGSDPKPGEISLAHKGVLFLDELPEFDRRVLEMLREPLESGEIHISRATRQATFPAQFQLVAAMNPCPCGYLGHPSKPCRCTPDSIKRYRAKISGPLLDRIDLTIEVPALTAAELISAQPGESSANVLKRVLVAREKQYARQGKINATLTSGELDNSSSILPEARNALGEMLEKLTLSARSFHRILRVAQTLADLAGDEVVDRNHVIRAIGFRRAL